MPTILRGVDNFDTLESKGLGDGQTWQEVTASRSAGVIYTNTTGRTISVAISMTGSSRVAGELRVDGQRIFRIDSTRSGSIAIANIAIVPNGSTYEFLIDVGSISNFRELR